MKRITTESCIFIGDTPARLLFRPTGSVKLTAPTCGKTFEEGRDYIFDRMAGIIFKTEHSRLPSLAAADLYPAEKISFYPAADANAVPGVRDGKNLRHGGEPTTGLHHWWISRGCSLALRLRFVFAVYAYKIRVLWLLVKFGEPVDFRDGGPFCRTDTSNSPAA